MDDIKRELRTNFIDRIKTFKAKNLGKNIQIDSTKARNNFKEELLNEHK